ncbi:MAG: hypothetical protein WC794_00100 [Candidatus Doudnabacteria bacterium]|jgi:hypothetical protein
MNKIILQTAKRKIKYILKRYKGLNTVFLDNWRGFRFIYDCGEINKLPGKKFLQSKLYTLLKNEKSGTFSAGLLIASSKDKKLFGRQYFLNCKTFRQYAGCFSRFVIKEAITKKEILTEMDLIKNIKIIYSNKGKIKVLENSFRGIIVRQILAKTKGDKKRIISKYVKENRMFYLG